MSTDIPGLAPPAPTDLAVAIRTETRAIETTMPLAEVAGIAERVRRWLVSEVATESSDRARLATACAALTIDAALAAHLIGWHPLHVAAARPHVELRVADARHTIRAPTTKRRRPGRRGAGQPKGAPNKASAIPPTTRLRPH